MKRRHFLAGSLGALFCLNFHSNLQAATPLFKPNQKINANRITGIVLQTRTDLLVMKSFYQDTMGLVLVSEKTDRITFRAGASLLTFKKVDTKNATPFYHFAFNIPENKILKARSWQKERTELIIPSPNLRDSSLPEDIVHFSHWNAHALFFHDPAGNIVELIARHDIRNGSVGDFSSNDILYISEIAFVVEDVYAGVAEMKQTLGLKKYSPPSKEFAALGDEHGLLLLMEKGRISAFGKGKGMDVFEIEASIRNNKGGPLVFDKYPYKII